LSASALPADAEYSYYSYVKKASVADMKNNLSKYLRYVGRGGRVTIYNRDTPVAELVPARASESDEPGDRLAAHVERLAREGIVRRGSGGAVVGLLEPKEGPPSGVLEALLDERATGR
jgi:prevent-host-death family protein